ncbi:ribonucleotide reductase inhibitor-domain-containing protein [Hypomontagnella monticulosa]|nr:ribonucleotide reductase inhibitor-domain-containing protein [Hypomontagnella monticulosa]
MSAPRPKRQFAGAASDPAQRQITSFFTSSASPSSSAINYNNSRAHQTSAPISPQLPASVQANLLSVGMRVRKSVPEGYKTGNYSAFALWDENSTSTTRNNNPSSSAATMGEGRSRANAISTPRELLPFCGLHKVGGLATQPETSAPSFPPASFQPLLSVNGMPLDDNMTDDDDVPGLTSSQETVESTDSGAAYSPPKTRKRSYTEDEEELPSTPGRLSLNVGFDVWRDGFDGEVSPRSVAPVGWGAGNGRVMATPRRARLRGGKVAPGRALGQENVMVVEGSDGGDFGEADFLVSHGWEVEMSDA